MKVMIFDTKRSWIKGILQGQGHDVSNFDPQNSLIAHEIELVLVHDSDFRAEYSLDKGQDWQQLYSIIFRERRIVVYSGGPINDLESKNNFIVVPYNIPYDESHCPQSFKDFLTFFDPKYLKPPSFPESLVAAYLLLVAEQGGLVVNELDHTSLWSEAGKQFCEEAPKRNLPIDLIPKTGWSHPEGENVSKCVNEIRSLFQAIEGAK